MARIVAGVATSHIPAVGAAIDLGKTGEPYWQPVFKGYEFSKQWMAEHMPDVGHPRLQRSRIGVFAGAHPDVRHRLRRELSPRPTKAGDRARCRSCRDIRS
jgi:hypothetical protein